MIITAFVVSVLLTQTAQVNVSSTVRTQNRVEVNVQTESTSSGLQKREEFKTRLTEIKDKTKQNIVAKIEETLARINDHTTDILLLRAERLEALVDKIEARTKRMEQAGQPIGDAYAQIAKVRQDIDNFKAKIAAQAGNAYVPEVLDTSTLKIQVGGKQQLLRNDLTTLRVELINIRKAIVDIVQNLMGRGTPSAATPSAVLAPVN